MIKLGLIGCGGHSGRNHASPMAHYVSQHPGRVELAGACDLQRERAEEYCRRFGFARAYADADKMFAAETLDACVCVMPVSLSADMCERLLRRGLPFTSEKPLGESLDDGRRLAAVARETGTVHMVSLNRRFNPYLRRAIDWARSIAPVRCVRARMERTARAEPMFAWGTGIHTVDAAIYAGGAPRDFRARGHACPELSTRWYELSIRLADGGWADVQMTPTAGRIVEVYELLGEGYSACVTIRDHDEHTAVRCSRDGTLEVEECSAPDEPRFVSDGSYAELSHFVESLEAGQRPSPTIAEAMPATEICFRMDAGQESGDVPS